MNKPSAKKLPVFLLAFITAFAFSGCGSEETSSSASASGTEPRTESSIQSGGTQDTPNAEKPDSSAAGKEPFIAGPCEGTPDHFLAADNDLFRITVVSDDPDGIWGYSWHLLLENRTDRPLLFAEERGWINGWAVDPLWAEKVSPGETSLCEMSWLDEDLELCGINDITGAGAVFFACDPGTLERIGDEIPVSVYPGGIGAFAPGEYTPKESDTLLLEQDGLRVFLTGAENNRYKDLTIHLYLENSGSSDLTIRSAAGGTSVNDLPADPNWETILPAGMKQMASVCWYALPASASVIEMPLVIETGGKETEAVLKVSL